jgi:hypothetical protein
MPWTDMPAAEGTDWTSLAWRRQFAEAVRERLLAAGDIYFQGFHQADDYDDDVGVDCQNDFLNQYGIGLLQLFTYHLLHSYIPPADYSGVAIAPRRGFMPSVLLTNCGIDAAGVPDDDVFAVSDTAPPAPIAGDKWAVRGGAHAGQLATYNGSSWDHTTPDDGYTVSRLWWAGFYDIGDYDYFARRNAYAGTWDRVEMGWTRKYPREIEHLADTEGPPGLWHDDPDQAAGAPYEDGQRARLLANTTDRVYFTNAEWEATYTMAGVRVAPPAMPGHDEDGMSLAYGVQGGAEDDWSGHDGEIAHLPDRAIFEDGAWWVYDENWENPVQWDGAWTFETPDDEAKVWFAADAVWIRDGVEDEWIEAGCICEFTTDRWKRSETQGPPDTVVAHGVARSGDYIGPWLFNELQAALNQLTCRLSSGFQVGGAGSGTSKTSTGDPDADWPTAAALAEAAWTAAGNPGSVGGNYCPTYNQITADSVSGKYTGCLYRDTSEYLVNFGLDDVAGQFLGDLTCYIIGETYYGSPFSDFGDPIAELSAVLWYTNEGVDGGLQQYAPPRWAADDDDTMPLPWGTPPAMPTYPNTATAITGYRIKEVFAVIDLAIAGGFEYVAEA